MLVDGNFSGNVFVMVVDESRYLLSSGLVLANVTLRGGSFSSAGFMIVFSQSVQVSVQDMTVLDMRSPEGTSYILTSQINND